VVLVVLVVVEVKLQNQYNKEYVQVSQSVTIRGEERYRQE
jgi:hypothetical protein